MKLPAFLKHWPVACLALATGLSGCAGGMSLGRREAAADPAGEVQIESVRGQGGAVPLHLVAGPCGRGMCDGCGSDGCASIIPRWLAASHEDTAAEVEAGSITCIPWRGVGTCDRPCGPCSRWGHHAHAETVEMTEVEVTSAPVKKTQKTQKTAKAGQAAPGPASKGKWIDLFVQRRQGVSRPSPVRLPPPAMPTVPLHGGPKHEDREPLMTQNEPPVEPRTRTNETSDLDLGELQRGEIVQTKAETKAPARSDQASSDKGAKTTKPLLPSQIAASRPTVRAAQMPTLRTSGEPPRGENPFETRRPSSANLTQSQAGSAGAPRVAEQLPRSPAVRSASVPTEGDRSLRTESLPPLRTATEKSPQEKAAARTIVADIIRPSPTEGAHLPTESREPKAEAKPAAAKTAPQVAEQSEAKPEPRPELRPTVRSTADRAAEPRVAEKPQVDEAPAHRTVAIPVVAAAPPATANHATTSREPAKSQVPAFVATPAPKADAKPAAPQSESIIPRPAANPESVVAVGTLHKPELARQPIQAAAPRPTVVVTQAPAEVLVLPAPAAPGVQPPPQPGVQAPVVQAPVVQVPVVQVPAAPAPVVIELPRPGDRFASLDALLLVAEHRYASVRNYRAELVQLRGGSPLPVRESLHFRYRKSPRAIIAGTSADPMRGRQAHWSEGADQWTVVAPALSGRIKHKLELDEERPLGKDSRPLIECGLAPLLDQLAVHRAAAANGQGSLEYRGPAQRLEFNLPAHEVVYRTPAESWHYYFDAKSFLPVLYEVREGMSLTAYELYDNLEVNVPGLEEPLAFDAAHQFGL